MADHDHRAANADRTAYDDRASAYDDRRPAARHPTTHSSKNILDWLAIVLLIVGGLNWGLVGLLDLDLVATFFGQGSMIARVIYIAIGVAAIWGFALMRLSPAGRHG